MAWWLSHRFTLIDATLAGNAKEIVALKTDVSNDIAGRKVVAEARTDIAQIKATLASSENASTGSKPTRTGASTPDPLPSTPTATRRKARQSGGLRRFSRPRPAEMEPGSASGSGPTERMPAMLPAQYRWLEAEPGPA